MRRAAGVKLEQIRLPLGHAALSTDPLDFRDKAPVEKPKREHPAARRSRPKMTVAPIARDWVYAGFPTEMSTRQCWIRTRLEAGRAAVKGLLKRSFWQSLIAVLAGNAIYFSVERFLPARAQHQLYQIDWGLVLDFWICLACYGLVRLIR